MGHALHPSKPTWHTIATDMARPAGTARAGRQKAELVGAECQVRGPPPRVTDFSRNGANAQAVSKLSGPHLAGPSAQEILGALSLPFRHRQPLHLLVGARFQTSRCIGLMQI